MRGIRTHWYALGATLLFIATMSVRSAPAASLPEDAEAAATSADPVAEPAPPKIRFNFKDATFEEVVDFFSRATGLPVVWETSPPEGTLSYLSPESYELPEALRVLNTVLQARKVMLRLDGDMLYLQKLDDMQRSNLPTFVGTLPDEVTGDQVVTVVIPLNIAIANDMAEKLAPLVGAYGAISSLPQQNSLLVTETAAQIRRLFMIIDELDREDPEGAIEIIPVRYTDAETIMEPIKALLSKTVEKVVLDKNKKPKVIREQEMSGLNISFDKRTNTIVAKGLQQRIDKLKETLALLDVPGIDAGRSIRTFTLARLAPKEAQASLTALFARRPEAERPSVISAPGQPKITVIGDREALREASDLLAEIDGGVASSGVGGGDRLAVVPIREIEPDAVAEAVRALLTPRQATMVKVVVSPDGRALLLAGPDADVAAVERIIPALDAAPEHRQRVRLLRVTATNAADAVRRAESLYTRQVEARGETGLTTTELGVEFDAESRMLTLVGSEAALTEFAAALDAVTSVASTDRETRQAALVNTEPSAIADRLRELATALLDPRDGTDWVRPEVQAIDDLDVLMITAGPRDFGVIDSLVTTLDRVDPADHLFRVMPLPPGVDHDQLVATAGLAFARMTATDDEAPPAPEVEHDRATGNLIVSGRSRAVELYERALQEARKLAPPARSGVMITLERARASDVIEPLRELWRTVADVGAEPGPDPEITVVGPTNSLYIVAEPAQHAVIERYARELDTLERTQLPPLRLIQVRAADAAQIAGMLRDRYEQRAPAQRREQPVSIDADAGTNTLIVTAHDDVYDDIKAFVDGLNRSETMETEKQTMIFALRRARATDLAIALEKLYPEPPVPTDRRGREMPHLRQPREVYVSADAATNTLIIEAPGERRASFEALVEQLDRVELPPEAELRTYRIERGDPAVIARTLQSLAKRGVLSERPEDGSKPVEVLIEAEPTSRTLLVSGDAVTFRQTEQILADLEAVPVSRTLRVFEIEGADPSELADRAQRLYAEQTVSMPQAGEVSVEVDRNSGTILVVAEDDALLRFAQIIDQLEQSVGVPPDVRLLPLEHANAKEVVDFLNDLSDSHLALVGTRPGPPPRFEPIERTNSVLVAAAREQQELIAALVRELDTPEEQAMPPLRILRLRTADAENLAQALARQYERRPVELRREMPVSITADPQTNALVVAAHESVMPEIQAIVEELNATGRMDTEGREIRIFPLTVARAEELARTIDEMFPAPPAPIDRRGRPIPSLQEPREVVVRADPQTNSIIVDAPIARMAGFEELVKQLDRARIAIETQIRTYRVQYADFDALTRTLQDLAKGGQLAPDGADRRLPVTVAAEPTSRTLVVSGPEAIFPRVEAVLADLDVRRAGPTTALRFFRLENARAEGLVPMLQGILRSRLREDVPDAGPDVDALLEVTADRGTNTLIISAPEALLPVAEELVAQLDASSVRVDDPVIRVLPLAFADPGEVATSMQAALAGLRRPDGEPLEVRLTPAGGSNALVLVGPPADLDQVEGLIEAIDARPAMDAIDARTFSLTHADATILAPVLQGLLADQQSTDPRFVLERLRRSRGVLEGPPPIRVESDARTNRLIVSGPQPTLNLAEALVAQLDVADERGDRERAVYTPASADATTLVSTVERVLEATRSPGRPSTLELIVEPASGAILIAGAADEVADARTLLAERDAAAQASPALDLRVIAVEHGDAVTIAAALAPMLRDRNRWPVGLRSVAQAGLPVAEPTVTADARTNRLLISAPRDLLPLTASLVEQLDRPRGAETLDVKVFALVEADAEAVALAVQSALQARAALRPGQPAAVVQAEPSSRSLVVTAGAEDLAEAGRLVRELDRLVLPDQTQVRTLYLEHARAEAVAPVVEKLLGAKEPDPNLGRRWWDPPTMDESEVRVAADPRLNAVIISAPSGVLAAAEAMVRQLDVDPADGLDRRRAVRVITVRNADAAELGESIEAIFTDDEDGVPPTLRVDTASNTLLVRATDEQFALIDRIVADVDSATLVGARQMRMIPIDAAKASAADVARSLEQLIGTDGGDQVEVITLEELLQRRRKKAPETSPPAGSSSSAGDAGGPLAAVARALFALTTPGATADAIGAAAAPRVASGEERPVVIAVDEATNSLIVVGPPRAIDRLESFAVQLQEGLPVRPGRVRYIAMPAEVDVEQVVGVIDGTLRQLVDPSGRRGALRGRTAIIADPAGNGLLVTASDADFETIGDLIAALGQPAALDAVVVKVYPLATITASRAAESVRQLVADPQDDGRRRGRQAQRMRNLALELIAGDTTIDAVFNPARVQVAVDETSNSLIARAPAEAIAFLDRYVELIDQTPVNTQTTLKLYPLRHAQASELRETIRQIFRSRHRSVGNRGAAGPAIEPEFAADARTNMLLVTAAPEQLAEIDGLLEQLDADLGEARHPLRIVELESALPSEAARVLETAILAQDQSLRTTTSIVPDDASGILLVRADEAVNTEIDRILERIDRDAAGGLGVRTLTLERANAEAVAQAIQRFFDDRARISTSGRGRRERSRQVSVIGDAASKTILVAANDADYAEIERLVQEFDSPQANETYTYRVFTLEHAKAADVEDTLSELIYELTLGSTDFWGWGWGGGRSNDSNDDKVVIRADTRLNAIIATGTGDTFDVIAQLVEVLDAPLAADAERVVRMYPLENVDPDMVSDLVTSLFASGSQLRRFWEPPDPNEVQVRVDDRRRIMVVYGTQAQQDEIKQLVEAVDIGGPSADQEIAVLPVEYADTDDLENTLRRFLRDRAEMMGERELRASVRASGSSNALVVSAPPDLLLTIKDLLTRLDQPQVSGERSIEIVVLKWGDAEEVTRIVRDQFNQRGGQGVIVTPDLRTNSLIINAPKRQFAQAKALIEQLDATRAGDESVIKTYTLTSARAEDAVRVLSATLNLDAEGATTGTTIQLEDGSGPVEVKARVVADSRSNSIIVTATPESLPVLATLIGQLDDVKAASPVEYRIISLEHALADEVSMTLGRVGTWRNDDVQPYFDYNRLENQLIVSATADQFEQIQALLDQIDRPSDRARVTEFVPLTFAEATQVKNALSVFYGLTAVDPDTPGKLNTRIVADPATNSLVITADATEWDGIRALLQKLDSEEYDASLQLEVIPLSYADAGSVAQAINQLFEASLERDRRPNQRRRARTEGSGGGDGNEAERRESQAAPSVLLETEEWVRVSAEQQTNSVIVSASRANLRKIREIIERLDTAEFASLPAPRLIPVTTGDPEALARSIRELYKPADGAREAARIVADTGTSTLIVRAEPNEFEQIQTLAVALQQQAVSSGLSVHVVRLENAPARRVAEAITSAFEAKARQAGQPLEIQVDSVANAIIVAATGTLFGAIEETARQLDALAPGAGQSIFIIELENIDPESAKTIIESIGLDQAPADDASRLVSEPVRVAVLAGRPALIVVGSPADRETIVGLVKALDAEPELAEAQMRVVRLERAEAGAMADLLQEILNPGEQQSRTPLAQAVEEQVRRLAVRRDGLDEPDLALDLTQPVRIIPDATLNAIIISSSEANVTALVEIVAMFDDLPLTGGVTVQLFPLQNIAADEFASIIEQLFSQGKDLGRVPGSDVQGVPGGMAGAALMDEIALSSDQRTNTVIVAGKEASVALVEVLAQRLDSDVSVGWVEPRIVPLKYADATSLAETLQAVLVTGTADLPEGNPLQRQAGRLRMARIRENGGHVIESNLFAPMTRLVIRPEAQLNALVLVGTPENLEVVTELAGMLDIQAASPDATVRIYPIEHASAARLGELLENLFEAQLKSLAIRPEDRVVVQADERTNALIVNTSPRSFAVLENLLASLDVEVAPDLREIRTITVEHASANRLAGLIQSLMDARLERLRRVQPDTADLERATIIADPGTNQLLVAAGNDSFAVVQQLARQLDLTTADTSAEVRVIPVEFGSPERVATTIDQIMERRYADLPNELREDQKPLILTDGRTRSLLVVAKPQDVAVIEALLNTLAAAPTDGAVGLRVLALPESANAQTLAQRLQRVMNERMQSLGDAREPSDSVAIEADTNANVLLVAASDENVEVIEGLLEVLLEVGEGAIAGRGFEIIPLVMSQAPEVATLLNDLYVQEQNRLRGAGTVSVQADERINAVVVNGPQRDLDELRRLVRELDGAKPANVVEIKYIPLQSANALETVALIENVLNGRGLGARRTSRQATVLKFLQELEQGFGASELQVSAAIRESIVLTPDVRTNTIIVRAPGAAMQMIERMISELDTSSTGAKSIRIFKLVNADATAMREILFDLFNLRQGNDLLVLKPREAGPDMGPDDFGSGLGGTELTAVPDERQQLSITVDSRTNSLLVSGTPTYLDLVDQVVTELDAREANEREVEVYPLRNAVAADVARVVGEFVAEEQRKLVGTLSDDQLGSAARLLEREVTIQGDEQSNTVLVSASPRYMDRVLDMIRQLDVDPPQVLIQVILAEVTLDSTDDWGVDFDFSIQNGDTNVGGGYGLGSTIAPILGIPNISVATADFDLLIRALQSQGRLAVLSNPSLMAANNQEASLQVGETIRVPETTSFTDSGNSNTSTSPENLGIILNLTPSINPDGFVRLTVRPEISSLSARTTQINEDLEAPVITRRTADTTVTVQDGQTIVLGGLIEDRFERRDRKVPFFGDLPFVGGLFRSETEDRARTELLIVLTPHVIMSPTDYDRVEDLTGSQINRLTLPESIKRRIREGSLKLGDGLFDAEGNPIELDLDLDPRP